MFIMHRADGREEGGRDPPHPPFMKNPPSFHVKRSRIFLAIDTHLIPRLERGFLRDGMVVPPCPKAVLGVGSRDTYPRCYLDAEKGIKIAPAFKKMFQSYSRWLRFAFCMQPKQQWWSKREMEGRVGLHLNSEGRRLLERGQCTSDCVI